MSRASVYGDTVAEGQKASALYLPGLSTDYVSCPQAAGIDLTGDLDIRLAFHPHTWPIGADYAIAAKRNYSADSSLDWQVLFNSARDLRYLSNAATGTNTGNVDTVHLTPSTTALNYYRITHDVDNGASGQTVTFYSSADGGVTWNIISAHTIAGVMTARFIGTAGIRLARLGDYAGFMRPTTLRSFELRNGIDGPIVASWDGRIPATRQRDPQGNIWTVNGTANGWVTV